MPHCAAACCRGTPSRTNAIASNRRTWAGSSLAQAAARSCAGVNSLRVTATAAPMLRSQPIDTELIKSACQRPEKTQVSQFQIGLV